MALNERVRIARRFLRSVRIDTDLGEATALEGFVCPQSSADVLITMVRHVSETGQGAFTWTGPYGSGKSSLVVALSALLNGDTVLQREAARVFGQKLTKEIWNAVADRREGMARRSCRRKTRQSCQRRRRSRQKGRTCIARAARRLDREQFESPL